jgi:hypothetical protein
MTGPAELPWSLPAYFENLPSACLCQQRLHQKIIFSRDWLPTLVWKACLSNRQQIKHVQMRIAAVAKDIQSQQPGGIKKNAWRNGLLPLM